MPCLKPVFPGKVPTLLCKEVHRISWASSQLLMCVLASQHTTAVFVFPLFLHYMFYQQPPVPSKLKSRSPFLPLFVCLPTVLPSQAQSSSPPFPSTFLASLCQLFQLPFSPRDGYFNCLLTRFFVKRPLVLLLIIYFLLTAPSK